MLVTGVGGDDGTDAQPATMAETRRTRTVRVTIDRLTIADAFIG
jgi:hypothetical protein